MRSEFEFIRNIKKKFALGRVGDDCAVLPKDPKTDLVVTTDMLVEDVDFRLDWTRPEFLGHKALAVSLSDIAAMGAKPKWALLSIGIPERDWRGKFVDKFYEGWIELAKSYRVELVGGDVSRSPDKIVIDSIVMGEVPKGSAILRSGAKVGDSIFVTGSLGGAAAGLAILESGKNYSSIRGSERKLVDRHLLPFPRIEVARRLRRYANSMIDVSDGLSADLHHVCDASRVGARLDLDKIPIDPALRSAGSDHIRNFVLAGGEDFELLFSSKTNFFSDVESVAITRIGEITSQPGIVELIVDGRTDRLPRAGYRHF